MATPTFYSGYDLAGRYRIIEMHGVAGNAEVYSAEDLSLSRTVTVKVLVASLATHEDVRREFRTNIVRASTLSHPHVARVYDGGQESGAIFMITEYLDGGSLEDVLASGRVLSIDDVARLGRDVAGALSYLHANGFVHGELSPSELVFDAEGRVRVTDVALAGIGNAYRERLTLDDVRYMSPEQAVGEPAGPESDIYSLALILFEAATGSSAFDGANAEAMLRARINSSLPVRVELGTLDMLLAQAAVADPRLRPSADQFASRLSAVAGDATPLVVAPLRGTVPILEQFSPAAPRTSIGFRPPSPDQIVGSHRSASPGAPSPSSLDRSPRRSAPRGYEPLPPTRPSASRRLIFSIAAIVIVLAGIGGALAWKLGYLGASYVVPDMTHLTLQQASQKLTGEKLTVTVVKHQSSTTVPSGEVISQAPAPGLSVHSGTEIQIVVSSGPAPVTLPTDLIGKTCAQASAQLSALKITASCTQTVASTRTASGLVAEVLYHATRNPLAVPVGSKVYLVISTGAGTSSTTTTTTAGPTSTTSTSTTSTTTTTLAGQGLRPMPDVVGMTRDQVNAAMQKAGLYYVTRGPNANTTKWTKVVSSVPTAGTSVKWHSTVTLNVQ
jgi:serine/threonine-protein kinase